MGQKLDTFIIVLISEYNYNFEENWVNYNSLFKLLAEFTYPSQLVIWLNHKHNDYSSKATIS